MGRGTRAQPAVEPAIVRATRALYGLLGGVLRAGATPALCRMQLPNGVQLVVERVPDAPLAAIEVWIRVGVAHETPETSGVAHLLEHLIFKSAPHSPNGTLDAVFENAGSVLDAYTERDWTRYCASVLPQQWRKPLQTLLQCLLRPTLSSEALEQERRIILNDEYALHHAEPIRPARYALFAQAFPNHPYGAPLLGDPTTLARIDLAAVQQFHRMHYRPERMIVVVVGAVQPEAVRAAVEEVIGREPASPAPAVQGTTPVLRKVEVSLGSCVAIGLTTPPASDLSSWGCAEIVRTALAEPHQGLLYAEPNLPFGRLQSEYLPRWHGSLIAFYALPPVQPREGWQAETRLRVERALRTIAEGRFRAGLEQARAVVVARHGANMRNPVERARWHGLCAVLQMALTPEAFAAHLRNLPLEQVERFADQTLRGSNSSPAPRVDTNPHLVGGADGLPVHSASVPDHATQQRFANGLRVIAVPAQNAETVVIQVGIGHPRQFGASVGELTARMLFGATQNETERTLAVRIARSGGSLRLQWTPAGALITAYAHPDAILNVLALLKEALFRAEFTESALQRAVRQAVYDRQYSDGARSWRLSAQRLQLYASETALQRVSLSEIRAYYRAAYRPENTVLVVGGRFQTETLMERTRPLFGEPWYFEPAPKTVVSAPATTLSTVTLVDERGIALAGYVWETPIQTPAEYYALQAWQVVLTEGKCAKLFQATREARGVGYEIRAETYLLRRSVAGVGWVQAGKTPVAEDILRRALAAPVSPTEWRRALALLCGEWERLRLNLPAFLAGFAWAELSGFGYGLVWNAPAHLETLEPAMLDALRHRLLRH
ncbi:MAG: insulinase family protein [Fimbriimonadales bacterium]|nr:insulinase family protein [Fimbriimonadales bacterium]